MTEDGRVWRDYDRTELDRQYSPSSRVPSLQRYLDEYAERSARARRDLPVTTDLRYGTAPGETLDFFPGPVPGGPLLVFVHGGNWQALSKDDSAFPAPALRRAGAAFAAVDYTLAPAVSLGAMVVMVRRALRWLGGYAGRLGCDASRLHVAGASAGAHLVACALLTGTRPPVRVAGVVLLSGMYELEPVRHCYVNEALRLTAASARRHSPAYHLRDGLPPVLIARGDNETEEYARQHELMAAELRSRAPLTELVVAGRNHFDLPYDLGVPGTALGDAVLAQLGRNGDSTGGTRDDRA